MLHPLIERIEDVLPFVHDREEFVVAERPGFTVIDYRYTLPDTWDEPMRLECRGIKFGPDGRIIARPLHKFFNHGEKDFTTQADFSLPHDVMEKMDGSMIHAALVDERVRLMTRMGLSDVALEAEELFLDETLRQRLEIYIHGGVTPIFEYIGPQNRIVEAYDKPELVFLQARELFSGIYRQPEQLPVCAEFFNVRAAPTYPGFTSVADVEAIAGRAEGEGVVIHFADGLWLKVKTDEYRRLHRIRDDVSREHDLVRLILDGSIDDAYPLFAQSEAEQVRAFAADVLLGIVKAGRIVDNLVVTGAPLDQKTFAVDHLANQQGHMRTACFTARKTGRGGFDVVSQIVRERSRDRTGFDSVRSLCGDAALEIKVYMGDAS
jgi:RNA ligase